MPCYEAPPKWDGAARKNAEQAVRILCSLISNIEIETATVEILEWFLEHRKIDLWRLKEPFYSAHGTPSQIAVVESDIARIEAILKEPRHE